MSSMSRDEGAKDRGRKVPKGGPVADITADVRGAIRDVRSALRDVREATSSLSGLGALIGDVVRQVTDVDTIKALADPTRLAILRALMDDRGQGFRVMSAKELAEELDEPQTKLYRHLKVLEAANLIEVAETRLVSGIVETRYRAAQTEIHFDTGAMDLRTVDEELLEVVAVGMDEYRDRFIDNARRGGFPFAPDDTPHERRFGGVATGGARIPPEQARELHLRLKALMQEIQDAPRDPDGVPVELLLAWYMPPAVDEKAAGQG
jgi:DNA-binding transcriptional ArsR family regulator